MNEMILKLLFNKAMEQPQKQGKFLYKQRPYIYVVVAILAMYFSNKSRIATICAIVLLVCGFIVFMMRQNYKENQNMLKQKKKEQKKKDF